MAGELWLDEHGANEVREWYLHGRITAARVAFLRKVLEGVATRQPHQSLGMVQRDLSSGDVAITDPDDLRMTVVIIPWADEAETFSVRYIGDLDDL